MGIRVQAQKCECIEGGRKRCTLRFPHGKSHVCACLVLFAWGIVLFGISPEQSLLLIVISDVEFEGLTQGRVENDECARVVHRPPVMRAL